MAAKDAIFAFVIIVLLAAAGFQFYMISKLQNANAEQAGYIDFLTEVNKNMSISIRNLQEGLNLSEQQISKLETANLKLATSLTQLNSEIDETALELNAYKDEINRSLAWFGANSQLTTFEDGENIGEHVAEACYHTDAERGESYIKTGCIRLVNEKSFGIAYKGDIETSGAIDKLQSLSEFAKNNGGDCEDFALFYKAEWNYLLDKIQNPDKLVVEAFETTETQAIYWLDFKKQWFYTNANPVQIKSGHVYPNVVCGRMYDLNTGETNGHCMIALTKKRIETADEINLLYGAPLIEPQNGRYYGRANEQTSGIYIVNDKADLLKYPSYIDTAITDNDMYLFMESTNSWQGYAQFQNKMTEAQKRLEGLKTTDSS